ncbi:DUF501 domain-containing protein [Pseudothermotoga thermarum]|uniref:DUF501 domain-containing protein n=1 Tax=Pseudothermotoga thermarum DSM 5069 TaxID=688269 RepID=F7YYH6_9THEM|nr:DUF501 domain-containing protein [Pseudothermotoga thermarum]AEH51003.1 protein of unknown function DUF501 [Pseudothermotoga thermarum DSM 5069]
MEGNLVEDLKVVEKQLGRPPRVFRSVKSRCPYGYPVTIECHPESNGSPFPTLYWLTCPFLNKVISRLESKGMIKKLEQMVRNDEKLRTRYIKAHLNIIDLRDKLVTSESVRLKLKQVGTGGIRDFLSIKCLHLHVADYLSGVDNPIGEIVLKTIKQDYGNFYCHSDGILCE